VKLRLDSLLNRLSNEGIPPANRIEVGFIGSCDLDLDPMTLIYVLDLYSQDVSAYQILTFYVKVFKS